MSKKTVNGTAIDYLLDKNRDFSQVLKEYDGLGNSIVDYVYGDDLTANRF